MDKKEFSNDSAQINGIGADPSEKIEYNEQAAEDAPVSEVSDTDISDAEVQITDASAEPENAKAQTSDASAESKNAKAQASDASAESKNANGSISDKDITVYDAEENGVSSNDGTDAKEAPSVGEASVPVAEELPSIVGSEETVFVTNDIISPAPISPETIPEEGEAEKTDDGEVMAAEEAEEKAPLYDDEDEEEPKAPAKEPPKAKTRAIDTVFDMIELVIFSLVAVLVITTFMFRHSIVDGSSMEQTLYEGEHLIISNLFYTPKRGDIIVCEDYTTSLRKPIVKRVIAVEGDHVFINAYGEVFINGSEEPLDEDYVYIDGPDMHYTVSITVPEGEIFVMGDHRNVSSDSRDIGTVSTDSVLGKVILRFYPFDRFGAVK